MDEIRVSSWRELDEQLYADSWKASLGRFRSDYVFRGDALARTDLRTSLMRLGEGYESLEAPLLRTFQRYARARAVPGDSVWNWLAIAQHHGLPTRLLDWTFSPYVALHFATASMDDYDVDGAIWMVNHAAAANYLPDQLHKRLTEEAAKVFTAEMLNEVAPALADLGKLAEEDFVVFLEPPSLDERIVNQFALFSLMSSPSARMDKWLAERPELVRRVIIPAALKWEIRDRLDQANITERVLFPGLDGLSRWLKRYYMPKPGASNPEKAEE